MIDSLTDFNDQYQCTICRDNCFKISEHPILKVIICEKCNTKVSVLLASGQKMDFCQWCTTKSELIECKQCNSKCCTNCLCLNLSPVSFGSIDENNWLCLVCENSPISLLQDQCSQTNSKNLTEYEPDKTCLLNNIISPFINIEEEVNKNDNKGDNVSNPMLDLDCILGVYEKQIKASLELEDTSVASIVKEINSIHPSQILLAVQVFKKCLTAFVSDLANFESRLMDAQKQNDPNTAIKLTKLLKIVVQHHIFNRLSHPMLRIKEEGMFSKMYSQVTQTQIQQKAPTDTLTSARHAELNKLRNRINEDETISKPELSSNQSNSEAEVQAMIMKIKSICQEEKMKSSNSSQNSKSVTGDDLVSSSASLKSSLSDYVTRKSAFAASSSSSLLTSTQTSIKSTNTFSDINNGPVGIAASRRSERRQRRSHTTPSWMNDFRVEKESELADINVGKVDDRISFGVDSDDTDDLANDDDEDDEDWTEDMEYTSSRRGSRRSKQQSISTQNSEQPVTRQSVSLSRFNYNQNNNTANKPDNSFRTSFRPVLPAIKFEHNAGKAVPINLEKLNGHKSFTYNGGNNILYTPNAFLKIPVQTTTMQNNVNNNSSSSSNKTNNKNNFEPVPYNVDLDMNCIPIKIRRISTNMLNEKEPRYCIPKQNGENLMSTK